MDRSVARVGSMPGSDVQIPTPAGQTAQVQLQTNPGRQAECDLLCLAGHIQILGEDVPRTAALYKIEHLMPFERIMLAGHTISVELPALTASSNSFSAEIDIDDPTLRLGKVTSGRIKIRNLGQRSSCQFKVEMTGLPRDCYQIEPVPLMYANAEEEVSIRFFHHGTYPKLGLAPIQLRVTSENSYPEEEVLVEKIIKVEPVFAFDLDIVDDFVKDEITPGVYKNDEIEPVSLGSDVEIQEESVELDAVPVAEKPDESGEEFASLPREQDEFRAEEKPTPPSKVFTNTNADFWNEDEL